MAPARLCPASTEPSPGPTVDAHSAMKTVAAPATSFNAFGATWVNALGATWVVALLPLRWVKRRRQSATLSPRGRLSRRVRGGSSPPLTYATHAQRGASTTSVSTWHGLGPAAPNRSICHAFLGPPCPIGRAGQTQDVVGRVHSDMVASSTRLRPVASNLVLPFSCALAGALRTASTPVPYHTRRRPPYDPGHDNSDGSALATSARIDTQCILVYALVEAIFGAIQETLHESRSEFPMWYLCPRRALLERVRTDFRNASARYSTTLSAFLP